MRVPIVDLVLNYKEKRGKILREFDKVLFSGKYLKGKNLTKFESDFSKFCQTKYAVGLASGTDGLHLSLRAIGVSETDEVITTSHTFASCALSILYLGAKPIFVDIEPSTLNINPYLIEEKISKKTKAILPVHLNGNPVKMDIISEIAKKYNLKVIEDACQAHGARLNGKIVGSFGDIGVFSFYPTKNLPSFSDAGAIVTNIKTLADKIRKLGDYGFKRKGYSVELGFNSRMDEIQATWLNIQLKFLERRNNKRRKIAKRYLNSLSDLPIILPKEEKGSYHVYYQFVIRTPKRDPLHIYLKKMGVETLINFEIPLHKQPTFKELSKVTLPVTERVSKEVLSLPIYPQLTHSKQDHVINRIRKFFKK